VRIYKNFIFFYFLIYIMKLLKNLKKFIKANHLIAILGLFVLIVAISQFSKRKSNVTDNMHGGSSPQKLQVGSVPEGASGGGEDTYATVQPSAPPAVGAGGGMDTPSPNELLPNSAPHAEAGDMNNNNLLSAGHHIGIDTVGGSRGNANLQLRADPVIQKVDVGPWGQSTHEQDTIGLKIA
jgi:hypothetical protein